MYKTVWLLLLLIPLWLPGLPAHQSSSSARWWNRALPLWSQWRIQQEPEPRQAPNPEPCLDSWRVWAKPGPHTPSCNDADTHSRQRFGPSVEKLCNNYCRNLFLMFPDTWRKLVWKTDVHMPREALMKHTLHAPHHVHTHTPQTSHTLQHTMCTCTHHTHTTPTAHATPCAHTYTHHTHCTRHTMCIRIHTPHTYSPHTAHIHIALHTQSKHTHHIHTPHTVRTHTTSHTSHTYTTRIQHTHQTLHTLHTHITCTPHHT